MDKNKSFKGFDESINKGIIRGVLLINNKNVKFWSFTSTILGVCFLIFSKDTLIVRVLGFAVMISYLLLGYYWGSAEV